MRGVDPRPGKIFYLQPREPEYIEPGCSSVSSQKPLDNFLIPDESQISLPMSKKESTAGIRTGRNSGDKSSQPARERFT